MTARLRLGKSSLLAGSDRGDERAAVMYHRSSPRGSTTSIGMQNLAAVLARINGHNIKLDQLLPWNWKNDRAEFASLTLVASRCSGYRRTAAPHRWILFLSNAIYSMMTFKPCCARGRACGPGPDSAWTRTTYFPEAHGVYETSETGIQSVSARYGPPFSPT
jgi:hypothetical protein